MIEVDVIGMDPAPQGSKNPWGGEANKNTKPWRESVAAEAAKVMDEMGLEIITGPVKIEVYFLFSRPKGHYGTGRNASILKAGAPLHHSKKPDTDKLLRAIGDALTGVVIRDDCQIAEFHGYKYYATRSPGAEIIINEL